jgi:hypothetical protein
MGIEKSGEITSANIEMNEPPENIGIDNKRCENE